MAFFHIFSKCYQQYNVVSIYCILISFINRNNNNNNNDKCNSSLNLKS